jgi:hypothetical protein
LGHHDRSCLVRRALAPYAELEPGAFRERAGFGQQFLSQLGDDHQFDAWRLRLRRGWLERRWLGWRRLGCRRRLERRWLERRWLERRWLRLERLTRRQDLDSDRGADTYPRVLRGRLLHDHGPARIRWPPAGDLQPEPRVPDALQSIHQRSLP